MTRIADGSRQWLGLAALTLAGSLALPSGAMAGKADDTLRIAWGGGVGPLETADVYFTTSRTGIWFTHQVWDTLVYRNPDTMQYEPLLATSW